ncbi:hypothetical protein [Faecalimicrobium sp. JNUCC 81]
MSKKNKKTNKELLKEAREEGLFKEAEEYTKKKYVIASLPDGILMAIIIFLGIIVFTFANNFFGV